MTKLTIPRVARSEIYVLIRAPHTWMLLAFGTTLALAAQWWDYHFDYASVVGHPEWMCAVYGVGASIFWGMIGVLTGASDFHTGRSILTGAATAKPLTVLAAKLIATVALILCCSILLVLVMHLLTIPLIGNDLIPQRGTPAMNWLWGVVTVNCALAVLATLWGTACRYRALGCSIWFFLLYLSVMFLPQDAASYTPQVIMQTAAIPFYDFPSDWWTPMRTAGKAWTAIAVWCAFVALLAVARTRISGVGTPPKNLLGDV